eukprot:scaffold215298_cov27-Tisochrysis_lutea.AAC.3
MCHECKWLHYIAHQCRAHDGAAVPPPPDVLFTSRLDSRTAHQSLREATLALPIAPSGGVDYLRR